MKSTELRIGNYISLVDGRDVIVTGITNNKVLDGIFTLIHHNEGSHIPEHTLAIPLTEEWLVKFGARVWGHESSRMASIEITEHMSFEINLVNGDFHIVYDDLVVEGDHACIAVNIKSIHKMQNLYFDLTGKELTIK